MLNTEWEREIKRLDAGQLHIIARLDAQDRRLQEIFNLLVVGKLGLAVGRWLVGTAVAVLAALAAWKGWKP
jgi:hypothetical protein